MTFVLAAEHMHKGEERGEGMRLDLGDKRAVEEAMKFRGPNDGRGHGGESGLPGCMME